MIKLIYFSTFILLLVACKENKQETLIQKNFSLDQNIVLFKDASTGGPLSIEAQQRIIDRVNQLKISDSAGTAIGTIKIVKRCPCDSSLVLLEGKDLHGIRIRDGGTVGSITDPRPGVSGNEGLTPIRSEEGDIIIPQLLSGGSLNYNTAVPPVRRIKSDGKYGRRLSDERPAKPKGDFVVGIIDTGLNPSWVQGTGIVNRLWQNPAERSGVSGADDDSNGFTDDIVGWNFVDNNNNPVDYLFHGSLVTALIDEQVRVRRGATNGVRYMILRTHGDDGRSLLFDNLCAMSYARKNGAKIINASWGFYDQAGSPLLTYFLRELRDHDVLFVAAAGNTDTNADNLALSQGVAAADLRNLAKHKFWPASADTISNVLTVSTITGKSDGRYGQITGVCERQNWADPFVDVGVANEQLSCSIANMLIGASGRAETGSSYAAPVVTGKLAAYLWNNWPQSRDQLVLDRLRAISPVLLPTDPALTKYIRNQQYVRRVDPLNIPL